MKNIDDRIKKANSFRRVITSIVYNLFNFEHDEVSKIYVDVNSCVSVLFRHEDVNEDSLVQDIGEIIEKFILRYLNKKTQIILLFTLEESKAHVDIFPDWCKSRNERVALTKSNFIKNLMVSLSEFSKSNSYVKVIQTHKVHPALVVLQAERHTRKVFTVLSKDVLFQCMCIPNMSVYTGVHYVEPEDDLRKLPDDIELQDPELLLPYYLAIRGDKRNEFPGVEGYGKITTLRYLNQYRLAIKSDLDHPLKEHCDKYVTLFSPNKLLLCNNEPIPVV